MRTAGVICECNPIHDGHRYLLRRARESGADAVVCVMSGCFTQRGEAAIMDPQSRAELLIRGGADAVFELPFPYSCAGSEFFAGAGVSILGRLGADELWFGSECGDMELLKRAAVLTSGEEFSTRYRELCAGSSLGTAEAYFACFKEAGIGETFSPNDILGIAYLRALMRQACRTEPQAEPQMEPQMEPRTVKRAGADFHTDTVTAGQIPSASALRRLLKEQGIDAWAPYFAQEDLRSVRERTRQGIAPANLQYAERAVLAALRLMPTEQLDEIPEFSGGLGRRVAEAAKLAGSLEELISCSGSKKYPASRVRRGLLYAMVGVQWADLRREPAYAVLLAANAKGCAFLKEQKKERAIAVVTSHAGIPSTEAAKRQEELTARAFSLYTLCLPSPMPADRFLRRSARIIC